MGVSHHRALQTSGQGWAGSKAVHGMECGGACTRSTADLSQQGLLPEVHCTACTKRCAHQNDRIPKNPGLCALVAYIAGVHHQPMGAGHMTVLQL